MKYTKETMTPKMMESQEVYFWTVQLVYGSDGYGTIQDEELVTRKYEGVEAVIKNWEQFINTGNYYVTVHEMVVRKVETYSV